MFKFSGSIVAVWWSGSEDGCSDEGFKNWILQATGVDRTAAVQALVGGDNCPHTVGVSGQFNTAIELVVAGGGGGGGGGKGNVVVT